MLARTQRPLLIGEALSKFTSLAFCVATAVTAISTLTSEQYDDLKSNFGQQLGAWGIPAAFGAIAFEGVLHAIREGKSALPLGIATASAAVAGVLTKLGADHPKTFTPNIVNHLFLGVTTAFFSLGYMGEAVPQVQKWLAATGATLATTVIATNAAAWLRQSVTDTLSETLAGRLFLSSTLVTGFLALATANVIATFSRPSASRIDKMSSIGAFIGIATALSFGIAATTGIGFAGPAQLLALALATVCFAANGLGGALAAAFPSRAQPSRESINAPLLGGAVIEQPSLMCPFQGVNNGAIPVIVDPNPAAASHQDTPAATQQ
jgi:hypothetical protein